MFRQIPHLLVEHLEHFLHPQLSPSDSEGTLLILRYVPLLVLLTLFWPITAWVFWLCIGAATGLLKLLYAVYNFVMIISDLIIIVILKTFGTIRIRARFVYYRGIKVLYALFYYYQESSKSGGKHVQKKNKKMRQWCKDMRLAKNYKEFQEIEIYEPLLHYFEGNAWMAVMKKGLKKERLMSVTAKRPGEIKKSVSADEMTDGNNDAATFGASITSIQRSPSADGIELTRQATSKANNLSSNSCEQEERRQNIVKDDLGMEGSMLLTTLARLKEAREQAASQGSDDDDDDDNDDGFVLPTSHDNERQNRRASSYHITASFITAPKRKKKWNEDYSASLKTLLSGIVKRNHLSIEDWLVQDGRSVAERGMHTLRKETRDAIDQYEEEIERCMDWIANGPVYMGPTCGNDLDSDDHLQKQREELSKRYTLVKRMKQNVGHTALMLSGGGALALYHIGSIKALIETGIYEHIHVISGSSGGSISAAMCAIKTPAELLTDFCVRNAATDYMGTGEQKKKNIRWFPPAFEMVQNYIKKGIVVDGDEFKRCCDFYFKDITFEEAYQMTRKHVCIAVSAGRTSSERGMQRLLLNHITTPNVTLASAVRASCAVPGVFPAATLMIKDSRGKEVRFEVDGVEWIDGSIEADIPTKRISTLFNVSNYFVCQANLHVVPFIHQSHHPDVNSFYWKLFQSCMTDAGNRLNALSQFGLLPNLGGNDVSNMFKQTYYGHLTLVPRFTTKEKLGLSVLSNPDPEQMDLYLQGGQEAVWPFIRSIRGMFHLERSIDRCLKHLGERLRSVTSGLDINFSNDDVDSVSSIVDAANRARLPGLGREAELLRAENKQLAEENEQLKRKVQSLQRALGISHQESTLDDAPLHMISVDENEVH